MKIKVNLKRPGKKSRSVELKTYEIPGHPSTVRQLILAVTESGVKDYNQRLEEPEILKWLTKEEIEDRAVSGKVSFGVNYGEKRASLEKACENAVQAFEDGIYRIFMDGRPLERLDEAIVITEDTEFTFVRLTMLAGRMW